MLKLLLLEEESGILCDSRNSMVQDGGENSKVLQRYDFKAEEYATQNYTGMKRMALVEGKCKSNVFWTKTMVREKTEKMVALCVESKDCDDLEKRKIYQILSDEKATTEGYLRVVDESGEDYLYPESYFIIVRLPQKAQKALQLTS